MSLEDFWHGTGGFDGNFEYGTTHLVSILILFLLTFLLSIISAKHKDKTARIILITISVVLLIFEIFWRIVYIDRNEPFNTIYPFYLCNLLGILLPIICLTNNKFLKKMFYLIAFLGGLVTFAIPQDIFNNSYLTFDILKSILQHTGLILIPVIEYVTGRFRPKLADLHILLLGLVVGIFNSEVMSIILGYPDDYMFFRSGLPFTLPPIPNFLTTLISGLLAVFLTNMALDPKGTKRLFTIKKQHAETITDKPTKLNYKRQPNKKPNAK